MKYIFDSEVIKNLPLNYMIAERAVIEELHDYIINLCNQKEEEMLTSVENATEKRQLTKVENKWINKNVSERRMTK